MVIAGASDIQGTETVPNKKFCEELIVFFPFNTA
jgi:hypothetical protein